MDWCRVLLRACIIAALSVVLSSPAASQTVTGSIQGTVRDMQGGVVPGATLTFTEIDSGQTRVHVTNDVGFFQAIFLPIGRYRVMAELEGFGSVIREPITVGLNQTAVVDFELNPAAIATTVTVTADAPSINSTNFEIKGSLKAEAIEDRPTANAGNFLSLAESFPGIQENPTSGQNNPTLSSGSSINFNGTGTRGATFQINGVNNDDSSENQNRQGVSLLDDQGVPGHPERLLGRVRPRRTAPWCSCRRSRAPTRGTATRYGYIQDSELNARAFFAPRVEAGQQPSAGRIRARVPDHPEQAVRVRVVRPDAQHGRPQLHARPVPGVGARAAAADARQRHAGEPRVHRQRAGPLPER